MMGRADHACLVYNGEFYGFQSHRERLLRQGYPFKTRTDTEVILALYEERGIDFLQAVDGMFAIALWDVQRERLILARDRLGIKPLFYATAHDGSLVFGSEIKALLASKMIDDSIDHQALHDYLGLNYVPGPRTMMRGIKSLSPGQVLIYEQGRLELRTYWHQTFASQMVSPYARDYNEGQIDVIEALQSAVDARMISDVPLGMFLSGGIDSTAILMAMSQSSSRPVDAFTIRFEQDTYDESDHARVAAKHFGARHHVETVNPDPDVFLGPLVETLDQPYADSSAIPLWYLCRMASQHVTVALGGDGGDELFAGYRTHLAWRLAKVWRLLPRVVRDRLIPSVVQRLPVSHKKVSFDLKAKAFTAAAARPAIDAHYQFKEFMSEDARHALAESETTLEPTVRLFRVAAESFSDPTTLDAMLAADFSIYLPDDILVKVDRMSMAHSLEARVPFLDHNFVQEVAAMPTTFKLRGLRTKAILKDALRERVPDQLLKRSKAGFNVPMASWLLGPLSGLLKDLLAPETIKRVGLWSPAKVLKLIEEHETMERDHSRTLWAMVCFMLFNERFRAGRAA